MACLCCPLSRVWGRGAGLLTLVYSGMQLQLNFVPFKCIFGWKPKTFINITFQIHSYGLYRECLDFSWYFVTGMYIQSKRLWVWPFARIICNISLDVQTQFVLDVRWCNVSNFALKEYQIIDSFYYFKVRLETCYFIPHLRTLQCI